VPASLGAKTLALVPDDRMTCDSDFLAEAKAPLGEASVVEGRLAFSAIRWLLGWEHAYASEWTPGDGRIPARTLIRPGNRVLTETSPGPLSLW